MRSLLARCVTVAVLGLYAGAAAGQTVPAAVGPIDRQAVVSRHNIEVKMLSPMGAMAVGNGEFAFNFDVTGLQSFPEYYEKSMPIGILSTWGWHSFPNPEGFTLDKFTMTVVPKYDRTFVYPSANTTTPPPDAAYLRGNPHRFGLGRIGLEMTHADRSKVAITDLKNISEKIDLWTGIASSTFEVDGVKVQVTTAAHPQRDEVATVVESPLIAAGRLKIRLAFPYSSNSFGPDYQDWTKPDAHTTTLAKVEVRNGGGGMIIPLSADFTHTLDDTRYFVRTRWSDRAALVETAKHQFLLSATTPRLEFTAWFSPKPFAVDFPNTPAADLPVTADLPDTPAAVQAASTDHWKTYWTKGGIIDLSGNDDPRAAELERRLILSQFVMAVHDSGSIPPQETGLGVNSWFGKYHMEMYWWHAAHWALWGHADILEKSLAALPAMMPAGQAMAKREGAKGVKWSKMTDPSGMESPSGVGPVLVWQQPHPIYLAELVWRAQKKDNGGKAALEKYQDIVLQTADYMATFVDYDPARKQYVLGPGVGSADEKHTDYAHNLNPTLELGYWKWGLQTAQEWRVRLGLPRDELYDKVLAGLAPLTVRNGVYPAVELPAENSAASMTTFLGGILPNKDLDLAAMRNTLHAATRNAAGVQTAVTWGTSMWAMCAARLNEPELAIQLLSGKYNEGQNPFMPSGYTVRRPDQTPMYFPANGGWLSAAAMMAAGWDGATERAPGFPKNWKVRFEGLLPMP